jgi:hypothetical protein
MRWLGFAMCLLCAVPCSAREGFSVQFGLGGGFFSLDEGDLSSALSDLSPPRNDAARLTGTLADGLALRFAMAYNIKGYASVEAGLTAHGWNLGNADEIGGSGHLTFCGHFHPLQLWLPERDYDASVFLGGGYSIVGGGRDDHNRGLQGGELEFGVTGRYFFTSFFSLGVDMRFAVPFYSTWFVDWDDDVQFDLDSSPGALFFTLLLVSSFHFVVG